MASISEPRDAEQLSSIRNFQSPPQNIMDSYSYGPNLLATLTFWVHYHSNMTLTFSPYRKRHSLTICEKSRYQRSACKRARLTMLHVNINCQRPLQLSALENVAAMSHFLSVSC